MAEKRITPTCSECKWWIITTDPNLQDGCETPGACHRKPPYVSDAMLAIAGLYQYGSTNAELRNIPDWMRWWEAMLAERNDPTNSMWPITRGTDFCGEFAPCNALEDLG